MNCRDKADLLVHIATEGFCLYLLKVLYSNIFALTREGLRIIEIAPGISLEADILAKLPFKPLVAENLQLMDARIFPR